jgi:hypothetical protein
MSAPRFADVAVRSEADAEMQSQLVAEVQELMRVKNDVVAQRAALQQVRPTSADCN